MGEGEPSDDRDGQRLVAAYGHGHGDRVGQPHPPPTDDQRAGVYYDPDATADRARYHRGRAREHYRREHDALVDAQEPEPAPTDREGVEDLYDRTDLTLGGIVAYGVGAFTLLVALANLPRAPAVTIVWALAGLWGLPVTRRLIEVELGVHTSRWLASAIYVVLLVGGTALVGGGA